MNFTYEIADSQGVMKTVQLADVIDVNRDLWKSGKLTIISLVGLQKIANKENLVEKKFETHITPTNGNKQQHVVNIWLGAKGDPNPDNWVRGSGEASILNTGKVLVENGVRRYEDFDFIDSKYRYAMAEKRAFSRAMLKLIRLYGVYSEVEAKEFQANKPENVAGAPTDFDY
jgi:hypothetical protein